MNHDGRRFAKISCALDGIYWYIAKVSGVKENLFWLLYALDDDEIHTQKQICDEWLFPKTTINTLIKECERAGYITLERIPGRGRELQIILTEKGKAYSDQALRTVREIEEQAIQAAREKCSPTFIADFETFAAELHRAMKNHLNREDS